MSKSSSSSSQYWNRETSAHRGFTVDKPIVQQANIIVVGHRHEAASKRLFEPGVLPSQAKILAVGSTREELNLEAALTDAPPNMIFVATAGIRELVAELIEKYSSTLVWIHVRSAGIEHVTSDSLAQSSQDLVVTNAKGCFSSTLAEYGLLAASYFAKDLPRLRRQQSQSKWEKFCVRELRGATMGIVGYGDIGQATAKLAKAYGMKVVALKRKRPSKRKLDEDASSSNNNNPQGDSICHHIYYSEEDDMALAKLCAECDYIYVATPLTPQTRGLISKEIITQHMKQDAVLINVGRGAVIDEEAMIKDLQSSNGRLKGVALDVFCTEPLPEESPLWTMDNVLLSPHNMDMTETFMHEATDFFIDENLPRFLRNLPLLNPIDKTAGY